MSDSAQFSRPDDLTETAARQEIISECFSITKDLINRLKSKSLPYSPAIEAATTLCTYICECLHASDLCVSEHLGGASLVLNRAAYEASVRLLWASGEPDGWDRERYRMAIADIKALKHNIEAKNSTEHSKRVLPEREKFVADWHRRHGDKYKSIPSFESMLRDIDAQKSFQGCSSLVPQDANWHYAAIYRMLSMPAHAHHMGIGESVTTISNSAGLLIAFYCMKFVAAAALNVLQMVGIDCKKVECLYESAVLRCCKSLEEAS